MEYRKLVRDKIPEIIAAQGECAVTRILDEEEYLRCLERKLDEEAAEFHESKELEELADLMEVIFALAEAGGHSRSELFSAYRAKNEKRGGFSRRIFLISTEKKQADCSR